MTVNVSRHGLYWTTGVERYHPGMQLRIAFPYSSAHDSISASEDRGEVVRTESLGEKSTGVAVILLGPHHTARGASGGPITERRVVPRYPLSATAIVVDPHSKMRLQARCSDISLAGCYIDTLNPFREGTSAELRLSKEQEVFETAARVTVSHVGMGMGLSFHVLTSTQTSVLVEWLSGKGGERFRLVWP